MGSEGQLIDVTGFSDDPLSPGLSEDSEMSMEEALINGYCLDPSDPRPGKRRKTLAEKNLSEDELQVNFMAIKYLEN